MKEDLRIGFDECNFHSVCPLYLGDEEIGNIVLNPKPNDAFEAFNIFIGLNHKGNYYFPKFLELIEVKAKEDGYKFFIVSWIDTSKQEYIDFYKKRNFRELKDEEYTHFGIQKKSEEKEKEMCFIKEL